MSQKAVLSFVLGRLKCMTLLLMILMSLEMIFTGCFMCTDVPCICLFFFEIYSEIKTNKKTPSSFTSDSDIDTSTSWSRDAMTYVEGRRLRSFPSPANPWRFWDSENRISRGQDFRKWCHLLASLEACYVTSDTFQFLFPFHKATTSLFDIMTCKKYTLCTVFSYISHNYVLY